MPANIAIVIVTYKRPASLKRLLHSLERASFEGYKNIGLYISVDFSGSNECQEVAEQFHWRHGTKSILLHPQNLGLKAHVFSCADLVADFDALILLEDDLYVAPHFYEYAQQALAFFGDDESIAGIALYSNTFNEVAYSPFDPLQDGFDNYFMQVPCSWGQMWTKKQWASFRSYMEIKEAVSFSDLPRNVQLWPGETSWKKDFYRYLAETGKYFVYPRVGLTTNFGDPGQHLTEEKPAFQTPLLLGKTAFRFGTLDASLSIYDGFYELDGTVYNKLLNKAESISFDLNGTKILDKIKTAYLVSCRKCSSPIRKYPAAVYPYENNVLLDIEGTGKGHVFFSLGETKHFEEERQFFRHPVDVRRIFAGDGFLRQIIFGELTRTQEYRVGKVVTKPYRFIKNLLNKKNNE